MKLRGAQAMALRVLPASDVLLPAVRSLAQARAVNALVRRAVPGRLGLLLRVLAGFLSLPAWVRIEAYRLLAGRLHRVEPEDEPTPPAAVVALGKAQDENLPQAVGQNHPSMQRHPAKRSSNKKRR
jgi:hypothetical protein